MTHEEVRTIAHLWAGKRTADILLRYAAQQEQSEREVAELRKRIDEEEARAAEWMETADQRLRLLTAAERKAEGLRVELETIREDRRLQRVRAMELDIECDGLKAKLAESERKLARSEFLLSKARPLCGFVGRLHTESVLHPLVSGYVADWMAALVESPSTAPAGVEAGKAWWVVEGADGSRSEALTEQEAHDRLLYASEGSFVTGVPADTTPTETEAPARCPTCGRGRDEPWVCSNGFHMREPADPAPPKPGGEARRRLGQTDPFWALDCVKEQQRGLSDYSPADQTLSLSIYSLRDAVEYLLLRCPEAMATRDARLEREGGGKS